MDCTKNVVTLIALACNHCGIDIGPLINLGTQHDGRSAWAWMEKSLNTFYQAHM